MLPWTENPRFYGLVLSFLFYAIFSTLGIIGGIYAMDEKRWNLALIGAIASLLVFPPFGIVALIIVSTSRNEFHQNQNQDVRQK